MNPASAMPSFAGYHRPGGAVGIRNHLLVLNATGLTAPTARRIHALLPGSRLVSSSYGMGLLPADQALVVDSLVGVALNANVGAILLLSADRPFADALMARLADCGKPVQSISLDMVGRDCMAMTEQALMFGAGMQAELARQTRAPAPWSALFLGLECGLSDPSSGIAANPLVGALSDALLADGGRSVFGETLEWLGCEDQLAARASCPQTAARIRDAVLRRERRAAEQGIDLLGKNPNQANIDSGLSTIEEKSCGSIAKSGRAAIRDLIGYGQQVSAPGLYAMDAASYSPESLTGFVASGAQLILFTTGLGNSYVSAIAPTIKLTANPQTAVRLPRQIDFDASALITGSADPAQVLQDLRTLVLQVASGALTCGETAGEGDEVITRQGNL